MANNYEMKWKKKKNGVESKKVYCDHVWISVFFTLLLFLWTSALWWVKVFIGTYSTLEGARFDALKTVEMSGNINGPSMSKQINSFILKPQLSIQGVKN